jgi:hypothetical protein
MQEVQIVVIKYTTVFIFFSFMVAKKLPKYVAENDNI